jgi:hypothetical protein
LRVIARHGRLYLRFPTWLSAWAAHLDGWINVPWCQLLFSERTLIEAANRVESKRHLNARLIPSGRLELKGCDRSVGEATYGHACVWE